MSFPKHGRDVFIRQEIEDEVGYEPIARVRGLGSRRGVVREHNLRARTKGDEAPAGQRHHRGAEVDAPVACRFGQMLREEAAGEPTRAAAELEDVLSVTEVTVLDEDCCGAIFVERLRVLACSDAIVDSPGLVTRQYRHPELGSLPLPPSNVLAVQRRRGAPSAAGAG
jgi:hypothetical protein